MDLTQSPNSWHETFRSSRASCKFLSVKTCQEFFEVAFTDTIITIVILSASMMFTAGDRLLLPVMVNLLLSFSGLAIPRVETDVSMTNRGNAENPWNSTNKPTHPLRTCCNETGDGSTFQWCHPPLPHSAMLLISLCRIKESISRSQGWNYVTLPWGRDLCVYVQGQTPDLGNGCVLLGREGCLKGSFRSIQMILCEDGSR